MACTITSPCGGELVADLEFNRTMQRQGEGVRRAHCRLSQHSLYLYRRFKFECLSTDGMHRTCLIKETRACGTCGFPHPIPACSSCEGWEPCTREQYLATLPRVSQYGHIVTPTDGWCSEHEAPRPCPKCSARIKSRYDELRVRPRDKACGCSCGKPLPPKATRWASPACAARMRALREAAKAVPV